MPQDVRRPSRCGPLVDILVNNLGIYEAIGFFDETDEAWQKMFEINIMSGVRLARHYLERNAETGSWADCVHFERIGGFPRAGDGSLQRHQNDAVGNRSISRRTHQRHKGDGELGTSQVPRVRKAWRNSFRMSFPVLLRQRLNVDSSRRIARRHSSAASSTHGKSETSSPSCAARVLRSSTGPASAPRAGLCAPSSDPPVG